MCLLVWILNVLEVVQWLYVQTACMSYWLGKLVEDHYWINLLFGLLFSIKTSFISWVEINVSKTANERGNKMINYTYFYITRENLHDIKIVSFEIKAGFISFNSVLNSGGFRHQQFIYSLSI